MDIPLPTNIFLMTIWYPERRKRAHRIKLASISSGLISFWMFFFFVLKMTFSCSDCSKFSSGGRHYLPHRSSAVSPGKKRARNYNIWTGYFFDDFVFKIVIRNPCLLLVKVKLCWFFTVGASCLVRRIKNWYSHILLFTAVNSAGSIFHM